MKMLLLRSVATEKLRLFAEATIPPKPKNTANIDSLS